jgi:hypothetical protein
MRGVSEGMKVVGLAAVLSIAALLAACAGHPSVLDAGVHLGLGRKVHRIDEAEARHTARTTLQTWRRELSTRAREAPAQRFPNLRPAMLRQRLAAAAAHYGFDVVSVRFRRPRQLAPQIAIRTRRYTAFARAAPAILRSLDPRLPAADDRRGWRFEGFYFEAQDERGIPFLLVFNFWRGRGPGGGQWARSDALFPFPHG